MRIVVRVVLVMNVVMRIVVRTFLIMDIVVRVVLVMRIVVRVVTGTGVRLIDDRIGLVERVLVKAISDSRTGSVE
jgi:hypothetical protein